MGNLVGSFRFWSDSSPQRSRTFFWIEGVFIIELISVRDFHSSKFINSLPVSEGTYGLRGVAGWVYVWGYCLENRPVSCLPGTALTVEVNYVKSVLDGTEMLHATAFVSFSQNQGISRRFMKTQPMCRHIKFTIQLHLSLIGSKKGDLPSNNYNNWNCRLKKILRCLTMVISHWSTRFRWWW